jgi:hypothetical protein
LFSQESAYGTNIWNQYVADAAPDEVLECPGEPMENPNFAATKAVKPLQTEDPGLATLSMKWRVHQKVAARA